MTEDRLSHIERMFRNPPSAAAMSDLGLELVAELRALLAPVSVPTFVVIPEPTPVLEHDDVTPVVFDSHSAPTPPQHEKAKRKAAK